MIKSFLLGTLVGLPILFAVLYFFTYPQFKKTQTITVPQTITQPNEINKKSFPARSKSTSCAASDWTCFINNAKSCTPSTLETSTTLTIFEMVTASRSLLSLKGPDSTGKCSFSTKSEDIKIDFSDKLKTELIAAGNTEAQIQSQIDKTNLNAKATIGTTYSCLIPTEQLITLLTSWSNGNGSSTDLNSDNCTATDPNGKVVNIPDQNGSIKLTPNDQ